MREVYFPGNCLVSLLTLVEGDRALEVGLVGREGMIGASLALGVARSSVRALVQGTGTAMKMNAKRFLREFRRSPALQRVLLQFTDSLMVQISQTAACNRFHLVEARLARSLLMTAERMRSAEFHLTHEFLAAMLGVRRVGVTVAATALQRRGFIQYRRGNITILDQQGLETACCPCYRHLQGTDAENPLTRLLDDNARVDLLVDGVAGTCRALQAANIQNRQVATAVADEIATLQCARRAGHSDATHAEHVRQKLVRDVELAGMRAIACHQQPASQTRFHQMKSCAGRRLHELCKEDIQVAIEGGARGRIAFDLACERGGVDAPRVAGALHQRAQRRTSARRAAAARPTFLRSRPGRSRVARGQHPE